MDIAKVALDYKLSDKDIPIINYTKEDNYVWGVIYDNLLELYKTHACKEFNDSIRDF